MNGPFFSVIVPVYNCESYLTECIESVISQTFCDWELILVDDGSSDSSPAICDRYASEDGRIIAVHKRNGGEFSARKAGLDIARGEYITGLDGDDHYLNTHLEILYSSLVKNRTDCILFPLRYVGAKEGLCNVVTTDEPVMTGEEFLLYCIRNSDSSFCDKVLRADLYKRNDYFDAPDVRFSEDEIMVYPALCHVVSASFVNTDTYCYRIHESSVSARHDFRHIEYLDQVIGYDLNKIKEAGVLTGTVGKALLQSYLHMLNVRIWDLMLSGQWDDAYKERVMSLSLYPKACGIFSSADYPVKEALRIRFVISGSYGALKFMSAIYRLFGINSAI